MEKTSEFRNGCNILSFYGQILIEICYNDRQYGKEVNENGTNTQTDIGKT